MSAEPSGDQLAKIFHAYDIRGLVPDELNADTAQRIARAFADQMPEGTIAVGRDMRTDSVELTEAFIDGLVEQGREVLDIGMVTTDMSYFAVGQYDLAGAAMITASHNPGQYNGIKLTAAGVVQLSETGGLKAIREAVEKGEYKKTDGEGKKLEKNILTDWVEHCLRFAGGELKPLKIGVDAGNGMGSVPIPKLQDLTPLEISGLYMELDGTFPNHPANPILPGAMDDLITLVQRNELDLGVAFDGDGDRAFFVDETGTPVSATEIAGLITSTFLKENPKSTVVANVVIGDVVGETVEALGGKLIVSRVGHSFMQQVMREENALFGAEHSGHFYYRDNFFCDSALITAVMVLGIMSETGQKLSELVKPFRKYPATPEENVEVVNPGNLIEKLKAKYSDRIEREIDGINIRTADWHASVRPSNTEPYVRVNLEAKNKTSLKAAQAELITTIRELQTH
ncbi:MAG: phosphomannomutase/phosphoglucomutase [Candidatus Saccharibacteria bacterium]